MAKTQERVDGEPSPDLLAAVVLHTLLTNGAQGISAQGVAALCEREPSDPADMREVRAALDILIEDGLARREGELFHPTRAAIRANELSF